MMTLVSGRLHSGYDRDLRRFALRLDDPPLTPNAMDDEFDDGSFDTSKWTWLDQGSMTASESTGVLALKIPSDSNRMRGIYQTAPSAPWLFETKMYATVGDPARVQSYLFAGQSTSGEIRAVGYLQGNTTVAGRSFSTPSSAEAGWGGSKAIYSRTMWVRLAYDGTNLMGSVSTDPDNGFFHIAEVDPAYTPTIVGLGVTNDGPTDAQMAFGWFRRRI